MEIVANVIIAPIYPLDLTKLGLNSQKKSTLHITSYLGIKQENVPRINIISGRTNHVVVGFSLNRC